MNYQTNNKIKSIKFNNQISICKFTDDSQILYVGICTKLYQFYVNNKFKKLCILNKHVSNISNIYCISNTLILIASSFTKIITKIDVTKKQQLLKIQENIYDKGGLDYNKGLNIIVSAPNVNTIKLWNGINGFLIIEKLNAHKKYRTIRQVLFILQNNKLISLCVDNNLIIWSINYEAKQLEQLQFIRNSGLSISLVLQQQQQQQVKSSLKFIQLKEILSDNLTMKLMMFVNKKYINLDPSIIIQHDSMKAVLIQGYYILWVCKFDMD